MRNADSTDGTKVRVLLKATDILEYLAEGGPRTLRDISRDTQLNKATCHRILATMVSRKLVEQGPDQRYHIGIRLFQLGNALRSTLSFRDRVVPIIRELADQSEETVFLAVRQGWGAVCLERIDGKYAASLMWQVGGSLPLHIGAAPRALLAAMTDEEIETYLARDLEVMTPATTVDLEAIRRDVQRTRKVGTVMAIDDAQIGTRGFGAVVRDADGVPVASISISGLSLRVPEKRKPILLRLAKDGAARASAALGYTDFAYPGRAPVGDLSAVK
ncbi:MAG TPA: IclR family transcriptional regulator [Solirubrobacteraceae bacterium]|jgi:DNA-binding IclR family transcriptional regulator